MEIIPGPIEGLFVIKPKVFEDGRGYFFESFNKRIFTQHAISYDFVQDNQSMSQKGVLRGLHFQNPPFEQGKLVRVVRGAVQDVVVDIRKTSSTYGRYFDIVLSEENKTMLFIPPGFAHGFLTLENDTLFVYKCTHFYNQASEVCILWNDPDLNINWAVKNPVLSEKDNKGIKMEEFKSLF